MQVLGLGRARRVGRAVPVVALARIDVTHADPDTEVEVGQLDGQQKRLKATVTTYPHFDPTKERVKGIYE